VNILPHAGYNMRRRRTTERASLPQSSAICKAVRVTLTVANASR